MGEPNAKAAFCSVPGILTRLSYNGTRFVKVAPSPAKGAEPAPRTRASEPHGTAGTPAARLAKLSKEVARVVHAVTKSRGTAEEGVHLSNLPGQFQRVVQQPLVPSAYGFEKLVKLLEAIAGQGGMEVYSPPGKSHQLIRMLPGASLRTLSCA